MKYDKAVEMLDFALKNQTTIKISKLNEILQALNFSVSKRNDVEVEYLKNEIKKLRKQLKRKR